MRIKGQYRRDIIFVLFGDMKKSIPKKVYAYLDGKFDKHDDRFHKKYMRKMRGLRTRSRFRTILRHNKN